MVCYGGDGTLLDGVRLLGGAPVPVVGINAGHMGFLTGGRKEAIEELFAEIARGTLRIEQRTMLRVEGAVEGMPQGALAVNEAAVQRSGAGMISVECRVDDQQVATYYGDGVIVSTPTGSTAYSLSAGGPVVAPGCRCLVISPLAPHNLTMRPVVVPDTSDVALRVRTRRSAVTLSLDNTAYDVADDTEIRVSLSEKRIFLGQAHNISFYDTLRDKMMGESTFGTDTAQSKNLLQLDVPAISDTFSVPDRRCPRTPAHLQIPLSPNPPREGTSSLFIERNRNS